MMLWRSHCARSGDDSRSSEVGTSWPVWTLQQARMLPPENYSRGCSYLHRWPESGICGLGCRSRLMIRTGNCSRPVVSRTIVNMKSAASVTSSVDPFCHDKRSLSCHRVSEACQVEFDLHMPAGNPPFRSFISGDAEWSTRSIPRFWRPISYRQLTWRTSKSKDGGKMCWHGMASRKESTGT